MPPATLDRTRPETMRPSPTPSLRPGGLLRPLLAALAALAAAWPPPLSAQAPVRYRLAFPDRVHHEARVEARFEDLQPGVLELRPVELTVRVPPGSTYTFLACYLPWVAGDGMEHRNSTVLTSTGSLEANRVGLLGTVAHEFFHAWNISVGGRAVRTPTDLAAALEGSSPGESLEVRWASRGRTREATVRLAGDPALEVVTAEAAGVAPTAAQRRFREAWLGREGGRP